LDAKPRQAEDEPDYLKELLAQAGIDAQASSVAAKLQEVVIGELHHRMKNTLAIVSAITSQSLKSANSLEEATKTIGERLHALGVAQDLLVSERWTAAGCRTLIEGAVKAFQSKSLDQFEIAGDNIAVSSGPAISLSMVIHELCTECCETRRAVCTQRTHFNFVGCVRGSPAAVQTALERARWSSCPRTFSKELRFSTYRTGATGPIAGRGST